jgi:hypothetical protein
MKFRGSPPQRAAALDRTAVAAAETFGAGNFLAANFKSIRTSGVLHNGDGTQSPINAPLPNAHDYDTLEFSFSPTLAGAPATTQIGLFVLSRDTAESATPGTFNAVLVGTSTVSNGQFPAIKVSSYDARYYVAVLALGGATSVGLKVSVAGKYLNALESA